MATDTTTQQIVDVVTPAAGESVTEGTILEWHVKVGDQIKVDATIVEISTDKVDVELPSPATGTVTEILVAEGDTVTVGQVIARIAVGGGAAAPASVTPEKEPEDERERRIRACGRAAGDGAGRQRKRRRRAAPAGTGAPRRAIRGSTRRRRRPHPRGGRVRQRGHDPRMAREGWRSDQGERHDRRDLHRQGRPRAALARDRHRQRDPRRRGRHRHRRAGDRAHRARRRRSGTCARQRAGPRRERARADDRAGARRRPRLAGRGARRGGRGRRPRDGLRAPALRGASRSPTCSTPRAATARRAPSPRRAQARHSRCGAARRRLRATWSSRARSRPRRASGRITVTTLDGRRQQLKAGPRKVSFTHLIAYAIALAAEQMQVMTNHFEEIDGKPNRIVDGQREPRAGGRRREEGRLAHADGPRDHRRRQARLRRLPRRLRRARREGAHEHPHRRRPRGREHHPHQPRRHRHDRLGAEADDRGGHDRRHGLDRLPARAGQHRRDDRRREGHDDDLDL